MSLSAAPKVRCVSHIYSIVDSDTLRLDHYTSAKCVKGGMRPALIFMFGGGFKGGSRSAEQYGDFFSWLAMEGVDLFSIDYRLGLKGLTQESICSPEDFVAKLGGAVQMAVEDLYRSTAYIVESAKEWGIDPNRVFVAGSSAGAISVLQGEYLRVNRSPLAALLPEGFKYAGVISFAGAVMSLSSEPVWQSTPAPIMLYHGTSDSNVPYDSLVVPLGADMSAGLFGSNSIARSLADSPASVWFVSVAGADHVVAESPMDKSRKEILSFIEEFSQLPTTKARTDIGTPVEPQKFTIIDYISSNF